MKYAEYTIWILLSVMVVIVAVGHYPPLAGWFARHLF